MKPNLDEMADGYITAALWSDCMPMCECGADDSSDRERGHLDGCPAEEYGGREYLSVSDEDRAYVRRVCEAFAATAGHALTIFAELREFDPSEGTTWHYIGHDLRLTSAGHGTGFWDRDPVGLRDPNPELSDGIAAFMSARERLSQIARARPFDVISGDVWQVDEDTAQFDYQVNLDEVQA